MGMPAARMHMTRATHRAGVKVEDHALLFIDAFRNFGPQDLKHLRQVGGLRVLHHRSLVSGKPCVPPHSEGTGKQRQDETASNNGKSSVHHAQEDHHRWSCQGGRKRASDTWTSGHSNWDSILPTSRAEARSCRGDRCGPVLICHFSGSRDRPATSPTSLGMRVSLVSSVPDVRVRMCADASAHMPRAHRHPEAQSPICARACW